MLPSSYSEIKISVLSVYRKIIEVKIIDDEEYEKNKTFFIELGEPVLLEIGQKHGKCVCVMMCVYTQYYRVSDEGVKNDGVCYLIINNQ